MNSIGFVKERIISLPYWSYLIIAMTILSVIGILFVPGFFTFRHIRIILIINVFIGMLAIAQTIAILSGGLDLSVGAIYYYSILVGAILMGGESLLFPVLIVIFLIGIGFGALNGIGIAKLKIPPIVMTLATMVLITGVLYLTTGGGGGGEAAPSLVEVCTGKIGGISNLIIFWIITTILVYILLNKTKFGNRIRALGSNPRAGLLSGIRLWKYEFLAYVVTGLIASITGLLFLGWTITPYQIPYGPVGMGMTLKSIAPVVLGGTFFFTGRGGVLRTFISVVFLGFFFSMLSMAGIGEALEVTLYGVIIITMPAVKGLKELLRSS